MRTHPGEDRASLREECDRAWAIVDRLNAEADALRARIAELEADDRYPTAWAYEQACEALAKSKAERSRLHGALLAHYANHQGMGVLLTRSEVCATCAAAIEPTP